MKNKGQKGGREKGRERDTLNKMPFSEEISVSESLGECMKAFVFKITFINVTVLF